MKNIVMCPAGNDYYMSSGDAMGGIIMTLVFTITIAVGSILLYHFLSKRRMEFEGILYFIGLVLLLSVLNIWQFIQFI